LLVLATTADYGDLDRHGAMLVRDG
jgi:hypothetical protein